MADARIQSFVDEFNALIRTAITEEELRTAFSIAAYNQLGIQLKLERNRQDARRNFVIVEFKRKGTFRGTANSSKFKEARDQLTQIYIPTQAANDGHSLSDYIGVCFDGLHLAFVFIETTGRIRVTDLR